MTLVLASVASTASWQLSKTGTDPSRAVWPPLPGVTPATTFVPYACIWVAWNRPSRPVMPWTMRRVEWSTRMLIGSGLRCAGDRDGLLDRFVQVACCLDVAAGDAQDL